MRTWDTDEHTAKTIRKIGFDLLILEDKMFKRSITKFTLAFFFLKMRMYGK